MRYALQPLLRQLKHLTSQQSHVGALWLFENHLSFFNAKPVRDFISYNR
jgi:hypothetical protein